MSNKQSLQNKNTRLQKATQNWTDLCDYIKETFPRRDITIRENGTYDVSSAATANIEVPSYAEGAAAGYELADSIVERTITTFSNDRITKVGSYAFARHSLLQAINIPNVTHIDVYGFNYCTGLTEIELPKVERIESQSFNSCSKLTKVDAPMLKYIGAHSMTASKLTTLIIRQTNSICTLQNAAAIDMTPIQKGEGYIYVPDELVDQYRTATNWSVYATQILPLSFLNITLPTEYQALEYIDSTGTQYIDTGVNINTETDTTTFIFQALDKTIYKWFFGEYDAGARIGLGSGDGTDKRNVLYGTTTQKVADSLLYNTKHIYKVDKNGITIDQTNILGFTAFESTSTLHLGNLNYDSGSSYTASTRIWGYRHTRDGAMVRYMVPCYRIADDVVGMYDLIENKFYENKGTGSFIKGPVA
jgi:hypothetical protein